MNLRGLRRDVRALQRLGQMLGQAPQERAPARDPDIVMVEIAPGVFSQRVQPRVPVVSSRALVELQRALELGDSVAQRLHNLRRASAGRSRQR
jgi:hypothetical protein